MAVSQTDTVFKRDELFCNQSPRKNMTWFSRSYDATNLSTAANAISGELSSLQQAFLSSPAGLVPRYTTSYEPAAHN